MRIEVLAIVREERPQVGFNGGSHILKRINAFCHCEGKWLAFFRGIRENELGAD